MTGYYGTCLCGNAKFEVQGTFDGFYLCHCQHCQKDTGSAHAANLFSKSAKLSWLAGSESVTTFRLPGTRHTKSFCKFCGSALPNIHEGGLLLVPAGCLDTAVSMSPTAHIFTSSKADWDKDLDDVPEFEKLPE
ncbi:GFA family protein [Arsukibacterium sp.]|uniref:GFA family protein n=1 Tax=Arsukibacterium sp. TaxID=1977258 RepID=UPI00299D4B37|nr:GFA family protein [Arsukibacterium sp.]MDX1538051.1 GFA family protein [Arsukibacterium sp.]